MAWLTALGALVVGLALRVGVPLGLTALLVWQLRRLDARWQRAAEQEHARGGEVRLPQVRCWEIRRCAPVRRIACPAYLHPEIPCWQNFRDDRGHLEERCLECVVFRQALAPLPA